MASIKVLNIILVLLCIFATAFVCTFLAITSSNKALNDTKHSRDASVSSSFEVGEESVTNRTTEYLDLLMSSTIGYLEQFMMAHRLVSTSIANEIMAEPWDVVKNMAWHHLPRDYNAYKLLRNQGNTGVLIILKNMLTIMYFESTDTIELPNDAVHVMFMVMNYGTDSPWGGYGRTLRASANATGYPALVTDPLTDVDWSVKTVDDLRKCYRAVHSNGTIPDLPCNSPGWDDPTTHPSVSLGYAVPKGQTLYSPPIAIDTWYLALSCISPIYHDDTLTGVVGSGADLRQISNYLASLEIGGPVEGYPSRARVFITLRDNWLKLLANKGAMLGASHGSCIGRNTNGVPHALYPIESSDHIISSVANRTIEDSIDIEGMAVSGNMTVLNITTDLAPTGEPFYYRVGRQYDEFGIDWYVHLVIDREYILGTIDKKVASTKQDIQVAEKKVDDDLRTAQIILYISVGAVAVALTLLSAILVLRIIEPLVVLEREMAAVAVMRLEDVDTKRPLSALDEVRLMQVSFLQMIKNLVEYRNYMPASVLQVDDDDETSAHEASSTEMSKMTLSRTSGGSSQGTSRVIYKNMHGHFGNEVRAKRVTLMVCNMVGFLQVHDTQHIQTMISSYLIAGLQHLKTSKGIPDSFSGDRLYASWNGARVCASHRTAAYLCARDMCSDKSITNKLSIGLASGEVKCGNMGCEGMKKYSYIGSLSSWVHVVERIGRSMECEVAIDGVVNEEVCNRAYTRMLQHVVFNKHSENVLRVYEAQKPKQVTEEEWMYQLEESHVKDPNKAYNSSYELFMEGRVEEAVNEIAGVDDGSRVMQLYKERLRCSRANPILTEPVGKREVLYS